MSQQSRTADEPAREAPEPSDAFDLEVGTPDLVRLYLDEIGKAPLLDAATEVDLAQRIEAGLYARHLLDALGHRRAVKLREARKVASTGELTRLVTDGDLAKRAFIRANLRLVVSLARRYNRASMPLLDLIQEGNVGLVRAVEKFDYARGYKFSTYATWWIRQAVQRGVANKSRTIRIPVHIVEREQKMSRAERALTTQLERDPTDEEVAERAKLSLKHVKEVRAAARAVTSLDKPVGATGDASFGDLIAGEDVEPSEEVHVSLAEDAVRNAVETLPEREREIVKLRYGMNGDPDPKSLEEIGRTLGLTRERVRQIEARALQRLAERREVAALGEPSA